MAPLYLLLPRAVRQVELANGVMVAGWEALAWARGMYSLDLTEAPDTEAATSDVRFYYEARPDYEAEAIRRVPVVQNLWHEVGLAMSYAASPSTQPELRGTLERILGTAAYALAQLDATTKEK